MTNKQTKILVVEDNPGDARLIREFLRESEDSALEMIFADKLSAALECLEENEFDVILLDLGLPDSQGLDTLISIYNQVSEIPIIILSGNTDVNIAIKSLQRGAQDYLVKGDFDKKLLDRALRYALERHKINIELKKKIHEVSYQRALIENIIEKNADGLIVLNQNGIVRFVNPAATVILNRSVEGMLNQLIDFPLVKHSTEFEVFHKDGKKRHVEMRVAEINWEGDPSYLMAIRDITERKEMEDALRLSEERVKAEYKGMPLPTLTWQELDNDLILIDYNEAAEQLAQEKINKALGKKAKMVFSDKPEIIEDLSRCFKEKVSITRESSYQLRNTGHPGYFLFTYTFIQPNLVIQHIEEITGRKEAEIALKMENYFIETIIETANSLIVGLNEQGNIVLFNRMCEKLTGWKRENILGKNWTLNFIPKRIREEVVAIYNRTSPESYSDFINPIQTKYGERQIWWHNTAVARAGEKLIIAIGVDITEEEKSRKIIEELNQSLRLIIHILGHDVLNDFHSIKLALELIKMDKEGNNEAFQIAMDNIDTSVQLIKKMRELENLVSQGGDLQPLQAKELIQEIIKPYLAESVEIKIEGDCLILVDGAFGSIIDNLIQNAILHGQTNKIDIKIEPADEYCRINVMDYGIGIPDEIKSKIFEEGFKYGKTARSGLGLFIVKSIIERYGGEISVVDNKPKGSIFRLKVPRAYLNNENTK